MFKHNQVYGMDLEKFSAEEIAEKTNIANIPNDQLLYALSEVMENISLGARFDGGRGWKQAAHEGSVIAYEAFKRFYDGDKEPNVISRIAEFNKEKANTIKFWCYPTNIIALFEMLIEDGYFEPIKESLSKEEDHAS